MRLLLAILLLAAGAYGQIANPTTASSLGLGWSALTNTNAANFRSAIGLGSWAELNDGSSVRVESLNISDGEQENYTQFTTAGVSFNGGNDLQFREALSLGTNNAVTFSNITARGTLAVAGNVTMSGVNNTATQQTASSASSLMTRGLSDVRYLGEMWNASQMAAYATTNPSVTVFLSEPMVTYTNLQPQGPFMQEFVPAEKYAGKTVKLLAYCRVNSTNGGNVQGSGRVIYLTNTAGGANSNFPLSLGGQSHGTVGVFTNANTDAFPVATSTNQYLIFTSNVGTIPTNARMIVATFGFNRASSNTTYANNLYMHAVQLVVE